MARFNDWLPYALIDWDKVGVKEMVAGGVDINRTDSLSRTILHHMALNLLYEEFLRKLGPLIRKLILLGADIDAKDLLGRTPLHFALSTDKAWEETSDEELYHAIEQRQIAAVEFLVQLGADINAKFDAGVTSFDRAVQLGNNRGIDALLRLGVDVNSKQAVNETVLNIAISQRRRELLKCLVKLGADVSSTYSVVYPIHEVVELGRLDIFQILVRNGADLNVKRKDKIAPIMQAFCEANFEMVNCLAQLGADLNAKVRSSSVITQMAVLGRCEMLEVLVNALPCKLKLNYYSDGLTNTTALGMAVPALDYTMVEHLIRNGADVNTRFDLNVPPLVVAMRHGNGEMVKMFVKLGVDLEKTTVLENYTVLNQAGEPEMLRVLLRHEGLVNLKNDSQVRPIHDATARGDREMVRVLAELGADVNLPKCEGISLLQYFLPQGYAANPEQSMDLIKLKVLIESGIDLNEGHNEGVTSLHDAVRLGDAEMVHTLGILNANMNCRKMEGYKPLHFVIARSQTNLVGHLVGNGADTNSKYTDGVTPLHDAVRLGNVQVVKRLLDQGASVNAPKCDRSVLMWAILTGNNDIVKFLIEYGADVNTEIITNISPLQDAVNYSDPNVVVALAQHWDGHPGCKLEKTTALNISLGCDDYAITETLLKRGASMTCAVSTASLTPLDLKILDETFASAAVLPRSEVKADGDMFSPNPLRTACQFGHIDLARLLIIVQKNLNKVYLHGKKPLEYLPLVDTVDYHVLQEAFDAVTVVENVPIGFVPVAGCQNIKTLLQTPGVGDVQNIPTPTLKEVSGRIIRLLEIATHQSKNITGRQFLLKAIGSAAEGTKVGLPCEMDVLLEVQMRKDKEVEIMDFGNGYAQYDYIAEFFSGFQKLCSNIMRDVRGSAGFHCEFMESFLKILASEVHYDEKVSFMQNDPSLIWPADRKACSVLAFMWNERNSQFRVSVDIVPSLHVDSWPEGATTKTWLMNYQELRSRGYILVPKPPHVKSKLAEDCTEEQLMHSWKISFLHLETEHMQRLEQRIKDVYATAKSLRNPDVCRILVKDRDSLPRPVDKYVTSYFLKMCFFKNVEEFQQTDLSLEEMVCRVYKDLEISLSNGFIPLFFLPNVNALAGRKLDVTKNARVAMIMARFARALYLRDRQSDRDDIVDGKDEEIIIYQRKPSSVYKTYMI